MHALVNFQVFPHVRDTNVHMFFLLECLCYAAAGDAECGILVTLP
jgi:hypothetical protein